MARAGRDGSCSLSGKLSFLKTALNFGLLEFCTSGRADRQSEISLRRGRAAPLKGEVMGTMWRNDCRDSRTTHAHHFPDSHTPLEFIPHWSDNRLSYLFEIHEVFPGFLEHFLVFDHSAPTADGHLCSVDQVHSFGFGNKRNALLTPLPGGGNHLQDSLRVAACY